jgi:hypothetical protein
MIVCSRCLTRRRSHPPLALMATVLRFPLSRFTSRVGGGAAFFLGYFTHEDVF